MYVGSLWVVYVEFIELCKLRWTAWLAMFRLISVRCCSSIFFFYAMQNKALITSEDFWRIGAVRTHFSMYHMTCCLRILGLWFNNLAPFKFSILWDASLEDFFGQWALIFHPTCTCHWWKSLQVAFGTSIKVLQHPWWWRSFQQGWH